ncbi:hypothetical protein EON66_11415 [archaeon]|nr:MAG: hypothetical protein EON66_11415 [archaeon]
MPALPDDELGTVSAAALMEQKSYRFYDLPRFPSHVPTDIGVITRVRTFPCLKIMVRGRALAMAACQLSPRASSHRVPPRAALRSHAVCAGCVLTEHERRGNIQDADRHGESERRHELPGHAAHQLAA